MIQIDGSSGGGQLLRTALSLSMITKKPFTIENIRGLRSNPGLRTQHLKAVKAFLDISSSKANGLELNSKKLEFHPGEINKNHLNLYVGTAGSTTLILQSLIPVLANERNRFKIWLTGGTDTKFCPPSLFFENVFLNHLEKIGLNYEFRIEKFGFFPKGGGEIEFKILPSKLSSLNFTERGKLKKGFISSLATLDLRKPKVADRILRSFRLNFSRDIEMATELRYVNSLSTGAFCHSHLEFENFRIGADCLGEKNLRSDEVGKRCADQLKVFQQQEGLDHFSADQLLIYLALYEGEIKTSEITNHIRTNKEVIEQFLDKEIKITENLISC